ncbi:glycoside hydrolase family 5 protein [Moniliophthora roreri MCA 2997]|uniref:glucan 1,3-beta-glucosidase n=1 Tax=Moniliophthora roreri (strain MCA 2997) TaxID=1381753 RepID=V2XKJ3_MONRO|nr:glycoside hydrolase family 5 protein [Moniliophthora roreri MCA 2997]
MAHQSRPADNVSYDPLPLEHPEHPPSPGPGATFHQTPPQSYSPGNHTPELPGDDLGLPAAAAQPRFLGHALYQESGHSVRNSYASSQHDYASIGRNSEYNSSVYALNDPRDPQSLSYEGQYRDDPHDEQGVSMSPMGRSRYMDEKRAVYAPPKSKRRVIIIAIIVAAILLILAIAIPVYFAVVKPNNKKANSDGSTSDSTSGGSGNGGGGKGTIAAVTGGDGSEVTMEDGSKMQYTNPFGGYWYYDVNDPFNNGAKAQSWTPALNETFNYGTDRIRGVNLGGWLTIEPFIAPALFEKYASSNPKPVDEYTLHSAIKEKTGSFDDIEDHYKTFITEQDFVEMAGAGINYIRLPLPYWAIEVRENEPFYPKAAWNYFLKAIGWARKYGIRINLDLHAVPGSQNGWNHSGKLGDMNWLVGPMGLANAQRTLDYIRILAEFISQSQYCDVVTMFGIINEPRAVFAGNSQIMAFYAEAYKIIRDITGIGEGTWISFHDAFLSRDDWAGFLRGGDRMTLDSHPYIAFGGQSTEGWGSRTGSPCGWGGDVNKSMAAFGLTSAGEFSNAINDCGLWVNGVGQGVRYEGSFVAESFPRVGDCSQWTDWTKFDGNTKKEIKDFAMASMDGLQNYFFWTWKIGNSTDTGKVESPAWSYQLGLENGWMPKDPREADGFCGNTAPFTGAIQTGGANADVGAYPWPPATISGGGAATAVPTYTPTGAVPTLTGGTPTVSGLKPTKTADIGNGWANSNDQAGMMVPVAGCNYLDPWVGSNAPVPNPLCDGSKQDLQATPPPAM